MTRILVAVVLAAVVAGCATPNPRGVMVRQTEDGGVVQLWNEDDVEPSQRIARRDADRQMAAACAPRGYKVTVMEKAPNGNSVGTYVGSGVSVSRQIMVTTLTYVCL